MNTERRIVLHNVQGRVLLAGTDDAGSEWEQFVVDAFAGEELGTCFICAAPLTAGWMCLDGGGDETCCDDHIFLCDDIQSSHMDESS